MDIAYVNLVPREIDNGRIHSFLSELADYLIFLRGDVDISVKNAEDLFPRVNSYIDKVINFYYSNKREEVAGINAFFDVLNKHRSTDEIRSKKLYLGEEESIYGVLDEGFKKKFSFENSKIVVISGRKYEIFNPYGDATLKGTVCVNRCLEKYSIWHETAHLFGADDHYDKTDHHTTCGDEKCFMQRNPRIGKHFCKQVESEIRGYLKSGCNR